MEDDSIRRAQEREDREADRMRKNELDDAKHEMKIAALNAQERLEEGMKMLLIPCSEEALIQENSENMSAMGMATNQPTQEDAMLNANRNALSEITTRFLGVMKNGIEQYTKDSRAKSGNRGIEAQLEGLAITIGEKEENKQFKVACRKFTKTKLGNYNCYVALYVPVDYVTDDGIKLGVWLSNLRTYRKNDNHKAMLTHERIKKLEAIGMIWDVPDYLWQQNYNALLDYYRSHGNIDVPKGYVTEGGIKLYQWLLNVKQAYRRTDRKGYRLSASQIQQLEELGVDWRTRSEIVFESGLSHAKEYFSENRNLDVPVSYKSPDGYKLGGWISDQKEKFAAGKLTQDKIEALEQVGMVWEKPDPWEERFALAEKYYREHGDLEIPPSYTIDGIWVSKWLDEQRQIRNGKRKGKSLTDEQIKRLDEIGMRWCKKEELQWDEQFADVRAYRQNYGNINIPQSYLSPNGRRSGLWLQRQRKKLRDGKLSVKQEQLLRAVGV